MPRLERWSLVNLAASPWQPPEVGVQGLHGRVYGHPRFEDGDEVTTTRVVKVEVEKLYAPDGVSCCIAVLTASGSRYTLGEVDPGYEAAFPNARERLAKQGEK